MAKVAPTWITKTFCNQSQLFLNGLLSIIIPLSIILLVGLVIYLAFKLRQADDLIRQNKKKTQKEIQNIKVNKDLQKQGQQQISKRGKVDLQNFTKQKASIQKKFTIKLQQQKENNQKLKSQNQRLKIQTQDIMSRNSSLELKSSELQTKYNELLYKHQQQMKQMLKRDNEERVTQASKLSENQKSLTQVKQLRQKLQSQEQIRKELQNTLTKQAEEMQAKEQIFTEKIKHLEEYLQNQLHLSKEQLQRINQFNQKERIKQVDDLKSVIVKLKKELDSLNQVLKTKEDVLAKTKIQLQRVEKSKKNELLIYEQQIKQTNNQRQRLILQKGELNRLKQQKQQQIKLLKYKIQELQAKRSLDSQSYPKALKAKDDKINLLHLEIKGLLKKLENLNKALQDNKEIIKSLQDCNTQTRQTLDQKCNQLQQIKQQARRYTQQMQQAEGLSKRQAELGKKQMKIVEDFKKIQEKNEGLFRRQAELREKQRNLQQKHNSFTQQLNLLRQNQFSNVFEGDILQDWPQHKEFLQNSIEQYTKKKILKTKKIHVSQKDLNFSFHKYVDQVPQIVVLVKTVAGYYLAGYSQSPITSKAPADKGGLIIGLNRQKCFPLIKGKKSVTYDSFFLIIGNSEIRLKNQEWKVFSNFGIANSFFNNMGCGVDDLLGQGPASRQVPIVNFQVHRIIYK